MNNSEWAESYSKRFGLMYVNYATQRRIPKLSYDWYQQLIRHRAIALSCDRAARANRQLAMASTAIPASAAAPIIIEARRRVTRPMRRARSPAPLPLKRRRQRFDCPALS